VPSYSAAAALLGTLRAACHLVEQLAPAVHRASLQLLAQLAHSFFMPLCLTSLAVIARIQVSTISAVIPALLTDPAVQACRQSFGSLPAGHTGCFESLTL
jgi:hypothetical protein